MKVNLITLLTSLLVLMAALWVRHAWVVVAPAHGRYYVTAMLMISCIMAMITVFRLIRHYRHRPKPAGSADGNASDHHRQHYRLQYEAPPHPVFVQRTDDLDPAPAFTCPVRDISETGMSLSCTGVYAHGHTVQGEIIFAGGRTAPVNGIVIREEPDRTCLRLHCTIDPPLLMAEQREQIAMERGNRPRPAVSKTVLDKRAGSLPSHTPKGICRLKRP